MIVAMRGQDLGGQGVDPGTFLPDESVMGAGDVSDQVTEGLIFPFALRLWLCGGEVFLQTRQRLPD